MKHTTFACRIVLPVIVGLVISSCGIAIAQSHATEMYLRFRGDGAADCDSTFARSLYVGAEYDLTVTVLPQGKRPGEITYAGLPDSQWLQSLVFSVEQLSDPSDSYHPSEVLLKRLGFSFCVTRQQAGYDSIWQASGKTTAPATDMNVPQYYFSFQIPPDMAGSYLRVSAEWNHPLYGMIHSQEAMTAKIVAPCSPYATQIVNRSFVLKAYKRNNSQLTVSIADSLVALGWRDPIGLTIAQGAAKEIGQFDTAIRFLDANFEYYHSLSPLVAEPAISPSEIETKNYQRIRTLLIEARDNQKQPRPVDHH